MKFIIYSLHGDGIALAPRLMSEGNDVAIYLESAKRSYDNLGVTKLDRFDPDLDDDPVIVFDMVGKGKLADALRQHGFMVVGSSTFGDRLELDRTYGALVMQAAGIKIPDTFVFTSFADGIAYANAAKQGLFFKPHGNKDTSLTFGDDDPKLVARMIAHHAKAWVGPVKFELQEKVEGIEVSIEGWFNGQEWLLPFNSTIEDKKLFPGDLGPNTGSMSSTVWAWQHMRPKIARETLLKLTSILRKARYIGPLDINLKGGYGLEFTSRFGYDALWALSELLHGDVGKFLSDVARGQAKRMPLGRDFAFGLRTRVLPEPGGAVPRGVPVEGVKFGEPHTWLLDVMANAQGELVTAGVDGVIGVLTDHGRTIEEAQRRVFARVDELKVPNLLWRNDAGARARRQINEALNVYIK